MVLVCPLILEDHAAIGNSESGKIGRQNRGEVLLRNSGSASI